MNAYILNRRAAEKLLSTVFPIMLTSEDYFARSWEWGLTYTALVPRLANLQETPSVIAASPVLEASPKKPVNMEKAILAKCIALNKPHATL